MFQTTNDPSPPSPFILKHSKKITAVIADNFFRKKLYETPKKDIPALIAIFIIKEQRNPLNLLIM